MTNDIFNTDPELYTFLSERKAYLGAFLHSMRLEHELTQEELAEGTGYSVQTISKMENGKANPMGVAGRDIFMFLLEQSGNTLSEVLTEFSMFCENMQAAEAYDERLMQ